MGYKPNMFCGLCWLTNLWEDEVPRKVHAYKVLADNGKPQVSPSFWSHLEGNVGLIPPKPNENLKAFRLARGRLYTRPAKKQFPLLSALWNLMGYQPKLALSLIRSLQGYSNLEIAAELQLTPYGVSEATVKATRAVIRTLTR